MVQNFVLAFFIPWLIATWVFVKQPKIVLRVAPFGSTVSFLFNAIGIHLDFWRVTPITKDPTFSTLPFSIGVYPVLASFMVYLIEKRQKSPFFTVIIFTAVTTITELCTVWLGWVTYSTGWNYLWTFISYGIAFVLVYLYILVLNRTEK